MIKSVPANYYQLFNADYSLEYPGEAYGGWKKTRLPINMERTAIVVMHATDYGKMEDVPGVYRCAEDLPRANNIAKTLFPNFLKEVRQSSIRLIHIAQYPHIAMKYPAYSNTLAISGKEPEPFKKVYRDETLKELEGFKSDFSWAGAENMEDRKKGFKNADFYRETMPEKDENIVLTTHELFSLCIHYGINHLIYTGFFVNSCLIFSPGGLTDMIRHGVMCSVISQLTTGVENKETTRGELNKAGGLWDFAILGGFVYDLDDIEKYLLET